MDDKFWQMLENLVAQSEIVIDRAKGTPHPKFPSFIYPLDYGFLKGVKEPIHVKRFRRFSEPFYMDRFKEAMGRMLMFGWVRFPKK